MRVPFGYNHSERGFLYLAQFVVSTCQAVNFCQPILESASAFYRHILLPYPAVVIVSDPEIIFYVFGLKIDYEENELLLTNLN